MSTFLGVQYIELTSTDLNIIIDSTTFNQAIVNSYDTILIPFDFSISCGVEDKDSIPLTLKYSYNGADTLIEELYLIINAPVIEFNEYFHDGKLYPGESMYMRLILNNCGTGTAFNPVAQLRTNHSMVTITSLDTSFSTLDFGEYDTIDSAYYFEITLEPESFWVNNDSLMIICSLEVSSSDSYQFVDTFSRIIHNPVRFYDDFEGELKWEYTYGTECWNITNYSSYIGNRSMYNGYLGSYSNNISNARVISDIIKNVGVSDYYILSYWHKYDLETNNDGVDVQKRIGNDGNWLTLYSEEGYTGVSNGYGGFSLGDSIYTGTQSIWQKQNVIFENNEAQSSDTLYICWRFGSNDTIVEEGYFFDEVLIFRYPDTTTESESDRMSSVINLNYEFSLLPIFPSIFRSRGIISYSIGEQSIVELTIFDISGREVVNLVNTFQVPGFYRVEWDGRDNNGTLVSSGVYYYRLHAGLFDQVNKLTIVR